MKITLILVILSIHYNLFLLWEIQILRGATFELVDKLVDLLYSYLTRVVFIKNFEYLLILLLVKIKLIILGIKAIQNIGAFLCLLAWIGHLSVLFVQFSRFGSLIKVIAHKELLFIHFYFQYLLYLYRSFIMIELLLCYYIRLLEEYNLNH